MKNFGSMNDRIFSVVIKSGSVNDIREFNRKTKIKRGIPNYRCSEGQ